MGQSVQDVLASFSDPYAVGVDQIAALRRAIYADGAVNAQEARALLHLHRANAGLASVPSWSDLMVTALADYYGVQRETPDWGADYRPDYAGAVGRLATTMLPIEKTSGCGRTFAWSDVDASLPEEDAQALILAFQAESGRVLDVVERRVLARIFDRPVDLPVSLRAFALDAVFATVSADGEIDEEEIMLLRRVLYGPAGDSGIAITRAEAEVVFALHLSLDAEASPHAWRDLFVKAVTSYVLFGGATPGVIDAAEASWLVVKLGDPDALDPLKQALVNYLAHEATGLDPRILRYVHSDQAA